jgi:hypothetical protein
VSDTKHWQSRAAFYANKYGVDPRIFLAQIKQESGFNPTARSHAGALGIAQIVPKWHPGVDPLNPEQALNYAARWMDQLHDKYGNYRDALSVYNSGKPWAKGQGISETRNYVDIILGDKESAKHAGGGAHSPSASGSTSMTGFGQTDIRRDVALRLLEASANGGQIAPGALMQLAASRRQMGSAERQFGPLPHTDSADTQRHSGGLVPNFDTALNKLIAASGGRVQMRSGYRSVEEQTRLWNDALKKYGSPEAARKWVAPPGKSNHNRGLAADLSGDLKWAHANAPKFGLYFPMEWEPWHIELNGSRG